MAIMETVSKLQLQQGIVMLVIALAPDVLCMWTWLAFGQSRLCGNSPITCHQINSKQHSKGLYVCFCVAPNSQLRSCFTETMQYVAIAGENGFLKRPGMVDEFDQQVPSADGKCYTTDSSVQAAPLAQET